MLNLTFDPFFNVKWSHLSTEALYIPYIPFITDPKVGDKYCNSSLILNANRNITFHCSRWQEIGLVRTFSIYLFKQSFAEAKLLLQEQVLPDAV